MFSFSTHPAAITVGGGLESAFDYLQKTWTKWLPVVAVAALITFVIYLIGGRIDNSGASGFSAFSRSYDNGSTRTTYSGLY